MTLRDLLWEVLDFVGPWALTLGLVFGWPGLGVWLLRHGAWWPWAAAGIMVLLPWAAAMAFGLWAVVHMLRGGK